MMENGHELVKYSGADASLGWPATYEPRRVPSQQLSIRDICRTLAKRTALILSVTVLVAGTVAAYVFLKTPVYEGIARVQIDPTRSTNLGLEDDKEKASPDVDSRIRTEITIIESDTVATQVMNRMRLYANPNFAGKDTVYSPIKDLSSLPASQRRKMLDLFRNDLVVKPIPATQVVEIGFRSTDPQIAASAANVIIDQYLQRNLAARVEGTEEVSQWVMKQMEEIRAGTTAAQEKLAGFQKANDMLGADESDNIVTDRLKQLNEELTQAEADRIVKEGRYRLASPGNAELISSLVPSTTLQVLRTQEADLRTQYAQLSSKFGSGYPKVRETQDELNQVQAAIAAEGENIKTRLANEYDAAAKAESMIRSDFEQQKAEAYKLNEHVSQYATLKHEVEAGQQLYDTLQLKLKSAGITSGLASSFVDVIDRAQLPDKPVAPRKNLDLALGLAAGLFGGVLLGLVRDSFDDTIQTPQEMEALVALPELVSVPFLAALAKNKNETISPGGSFVSLPSAINSIALREPDSPAVESYRALCSVVLQCNIQNSMKVLVITSATPGEGKSTVSCNLATALAQRGRKVLLVDADLRSNSVPSQLGITKSSLIAMCGSGHVKNPRFRPIDSLPNLHFLPAGARPTDPTGVLDSARLKELLSAWREEYDHIIFDTPPVLMFADAIVLATLADTALLVTRSGVSRSKPVQLARDLLARSGASILGFVLNAVRRPDYYYAYPSSYGPQYAKTKPEPKSQFRRRLGGS